MITSRRGFLHSLGRGAAATAVGRYALARPQKALISEPSRSPQGDGFILLYSNENAYGPSPKVTNFIKSSDLRVNRYPRIEYESLVERIAAAAHVKPEEVLLGCGSTDILRMAASAFLGNGKKLIQASPTFEAIEEYSRAIGSDVVSVPLAHNFSHDLDGMLTRTDGSTTLVYICNPNNPTATLTPRNDLEAFISKLPASTYVIIDEAYHHYAGKSAMYASFIDRPVGSERVIVTRTFSKVYGLAGLRLGYAIASPNAVKEMRKFRTQDSINTVVSEVIGLALDDNAAVEEFVKRNQDDRQEFFNQAMARALKPIDSHTNFVMMNTFHPAQEVIDHFRQNKILIGRRFASMDTYIRVSLGRPEEMLAFWKAWDTLPYPKGTMHH
jgi:histidinol-phosphate aminotransferase